MELYHIIIVAIIQGITEFLPISSSAHLVLIPKIINQPDQGLLMDVAVHIGTLLAVITFFYKDIYKISHGFCYLILSKEKDNAEYKKQGILGIHIIIASIPVIIAGFIMNALFNDGIRSIEVIAATTIIFGLLLLFADIKGKQDKSINDLNIKSALLIGLAQIFALIPGTSRSGVTMTMALILGLDRLSAAKFSLLIGIPTILGAGLLKSIELYQSQNMALTNDALIGCFLSFITALIAIFLMFKWLKKASFLPFVIYRMILGAVLLFYIF